VDGTAESLHEWPRSVIETKNLMGVNQRCAPHPLRGEKHRDEEDCCGEKDNSRP